MRFVAPLVVIAALATAADSEARPAVGVLAPQGAQAADADGNPFVLRVPPSRAVLVLYEDKGSADQNIALKRELSELAVDERYRAAVGVVAVADVSGYDFWPVRGFVAGAIRDESRRWGTTIFCDWSGSFRAAFDFARGASNVVLVGKDGRIRFASTGPLDAAERARLVAMLRAEAAPPR